MKEMEILGENKIAAHVDNGVFVSYGWGLRDE